MARFPVEQRSGSAGGRPRGERSLDLPLVVQAGPTGPEQVVARPSTSATSKARSILLMLSELDRDEHHQQGLDSNALVDVPDGRVTGTPADIPPTAAPPPLPARTREDERLEALLRLAQRGDGEAFGRIYDRYVVDVYRYLYYRVGSQALAQELTTQTFLRAVSVIDSFSGRGRDIGTWFMTIARGLVSEHMRSTARRRLASLTGIAGGNHSSRVRPLAADAPEARDLVAAVRTLKPEQQDCIVLRFLQRLSMAQTAEVMGRSEVAIQQLQLRGVRTLVGLLGRHAHVPGPASSPFSAPEGVLSPVPENPGRAGRHRRRSS